MIVNKSLFLFLVVFGFVFFMNMLGDGYAETESFTLAARDYERKYIHLNQGDEIDYSVIVSGGSNDDIELTIYYPDGTNDNGGMIYGKFEDSFTSQQTGTYVFEFDTPSLITNKSVQFSYEITKNTYHVYVDPLPEWADYASNVMYESTAYWKQVNPKLNFFKAGDPKDADFRIQWVKEFGVEHVGYAYGQKFIEVGLGDSNCLGQWSPYSPQHVSSIMEHEIGHILGLGHSDDPDDIMYHTAIDFEYGIISRDIIIQENKVLFIPICTSKDVSAFDYWVKTSSKDSGFDVFFVPSPDEMNRWHEQQLLNYYDDAKCFGKGYSSYGGICNGVAKTSGLLVIPSESNHSSLDINVKLQEVQNTSAQPEAKTTVYGPDVSEAGPHTSSIDSDNGQYSNGQIVCGQGTVLKDDICVLAQPQKSGGGCLIATATYGTELAPQVQLLREIRDEKVTSTASGAAFMSGFNQMYYSFSPTVADWERQNTVFKQVVKIGITPLLVTVSILNHVNIDSEQDMVGYGLGIILLNIGIYIITPLIIWKKRHFIKHMITQKM